MKHKKYHLIYFFSLLLFIFSFISTTSAQTSYLDSLDGKFALQFQISENFTLTSFQGATLSGKYHPGKRSALRLGIELFSNNWNYDSEENTIDTSNVNFWTKGNEDGNYIGITINFQYLAYLVSMEDIGFYFGSGPTFSYGKWEKEDGYSYSIPNDFSASSSDKSIWIGLDVIAGIEWSFYRNMSLSAEYGLEFSYRHGTEKYSTKNEFKTTTNERTYESFNIGADYVNFGISVYF
jgi:hypothetical protein